MVPKISIEQYTFFVNNNIPYTGYVIGLGYADLASGCILPETFGMFNPPGRTKSYNDSFCQSFFVPTVDISPYMYAKSLDISVEDITHIITKTNADNILVYLGNGKSVSVPRNDSCIDVKLVDDGANIYIEIKADSPSLFMSNFGRIRLLDFLEEYKNGRIDVAIDPGHPKQVVNTQSEGGVDWKGITNAGIGIIGGVAEMAAGGLTEYFSGGTSSVFSVFLIVDGFGRTILSANQLGNYLMGNDKYASSAPTSIIGTGGKLVDWSFGVPVNNVGWGQAIGSWGNDLISFVVTGGNGSALLLLQKTPTLENGLNYGFSMFNYPYSMYNNKPSK
jgi:hypothetical protein